MNWVLYQPAAIATELALLPVIATSGAIGVTTDTYSLYIYELGVGWILVTGSGAPISSDDTDSITTHIISNVISSDVNISANAASAGNLLVNLDIQSTGSKGLRAQLTSSSILSALSATAPLQYNNTTGVFSITQSSAVANGYLSSTDWNTFNNKQPLLTLGNLTDAGTDGIVITGGTGAVIGAGTSLAQHVADAAHNGYLSSTDWSTFNGKQAAGNYITALTGDGTASGPGSATLTLATVNPNVSTFGSASHSAVFTVNGKGLITAAADLNILIAESAVINLVSDLAGKQPVGNYITALTGDATASGPGSAALTLATVNANVGAFGSSTAIPTITANAKGLITALSTNAVIAPAGTLTGTTLASNVVTSSLTAVGTLATGTWNATTISIAKGGSGQTTANAALNAFLPTQTGNSGKFLTTNGTNSSWATAGGGSTAVAMEAYLSTNTSFSPGNVIIFDVEVVDTNSAYNPATGIFTVPNTGLYVIMATGNTGAASSLQVVKNGTAVSYLFTCGPSGITSGSQVISLTAGDTINLTPDSAALFIGVSGGLIISQLGIYQIH